jgi:hypothetical protein
VINVAEPVLPLDSILYTHFPTHQEAAEFESYLIAHYNPKYNSLGLSEDEQLRRNELPQVRSQSIGYEPVMTATDLLIVLKKQNRRKQNVNISY